MRTIGASNYSPARRSAALDLAHSQGLPRYESLQPLYNLYDRADFENELAPLCVTRVGKYLNPRSSAILSALDEVAAAHASTPASATSSQQLKARVAAASLKLDAAQIAHLEQVSG